nr:PAS domain S-box protein [Elusimicrobiota bacterium]
MEKQKGFLEQNLAESQGKDVCRILFDGSPDAIFLADTETGIIIDANPAAERLTGRPRNELIGLHQSQLHPARGENASKRIFKEHSRHGSGVIHSGPELHYVLRADGSEVPTEITAQVIEIRGKRVLQGFFRDVSERVKAEQALKESENKFKTLTE